VSIRLTRLRVVVAATIAAAIGALAVTAAGAATSPSASGRATLAGSVPAWAKSSAFKGTAAGGDTVGFRAYLGWRNESAVQALARAVSSPSSKSYGHYLTPQQFRQKFAPSQVDVNAVESWLRSRGFQIDYVPQNNHYVAAEGTVAQADAAFGVTLSKYSYRGKTLRAPSSALTIPSSLAGVVESVVGLDDSAALVHPDNASPSASPSFGFRNAGPFSTYWADHTGTVLGDTYPWVIQGYTPPMLRGAYGIAGSVADGLDGSGQTVAIIDAYASPTIFQDAQTYSQINDPDHVLKQSQFHQLIAPGTLKRPENKKQDPQGWYGEETLDVEAVHAMAPGANILYVGAPNNYQDLDAALNHVVDKHLANIVTNSYGWDGEALPAGFIKPFEQTIEQGVIEGIGIYFSSGDDGDNSLLDGIPPSADWPASSPFVTAVGGTSLGVGTGNTYAGETGWSTAKQTLQYSNGSPDHWGPQVFVYGGGGGPSHIFSAPWYQSGVSTDSGMRTTPDVSMDGDPNTGMLEGQTQYFPDGSCGGGATVCYGEYRIGGTSLSSPLFAGLMAVVNQERAENSLPPLGFANPAIYGAYAQDNGSFHDVQGTSIGGYGWVFRNDFYNTLNANDTDPTIAPNGVITSRRMLGYTGQFIQTGPGYDDMTGVGSPDGPTFLNTLAAFTGP
jgi:subtilase family serine protease